MNRSFFFKNYFALIKNYFALIKNILYTCISKQTKTSNMRYVFNKKVRALCRELLPIISHSRSQAVTTSSFNNHRHKIGWYARLLENHHQIKTDIYIPAEEVVVDIADLEKVLAMLSNLNSDQVAIVTRLQKSLDHNKTLK